MTRHSELASSSGTRARKGQAAAVAPQRRTATIGCVSTAQQALVRPFWLYLKARGGETSRLFLA
jgi:hypothetical protein